MYTKPILSDGNGLLKQKLLLYPNSFCWKLFEHLILLRHRQSAGNVIVIRL